MIMNFLAELKKLLCSFDRSPCKSGISDSDAKQVIKNNLRA